MYEDPTKVKLLSTIREMRIKIVLLPHLKGGTTNLKVRGGEGGECFERCGVNTVNTLKFKKVGVHDPPAVMVALPLCNEILMANFSSTKYTPCVYLVEGKAARERRLPPPLYTRPRNVRVLTLHDPTTIRFWEYLSLRSSSREGKNRSRQL